MECFFFRVALRMVRGAPRKEESGKGTHSNLTKSEQKMKLGRFLFLRFVVLKVCKSSQEAVRWVSPEPP
jgi:hypothetical protein